MIDFFYLYYPVIISIILLLIVCFKKMDTKKKCIPFYINEFIKIDLPIFNKHLAKIYILILCFASIFFCYSRDYSSFFPKEFSMEVFYDKEGINETLNLYTDEELKDLKILRDLSARDTIYFLKLDEEIRNNKIANTFFSRFDCKIHSNGRTSFKVEKIDGFQKYHLQESNGNLEHYLECPQEKQVRLKSFFEKLSSKNDYISTSLSLTSIIIKPEFKQTIAENNKSDGIIFNHVLYGLTKIYIFPNISYSNTVYLFEYEDKLYPIGYAVYKR